MQRAPAASGSQLYDLFQYGIPPKFIGTFIYLFIYLFIYTGTSGLV